MAYSTPVNPVAGTVITVAYATTNILDNIRWLRQLQGNADPPGSNYVVVSSSTTGTAWAKVPADALAAGVALANLGYTPVNKVGDNMTGTLNMANSGNAPGAVSPVGYYLQEASGFGRYAFIMRNDDVMELGNENNPLRFMGAGFRLRNAVGLEIREAGGSQPYRVVLNMSAGNVVQVGNTNNTTQLLGPVSIPGSTSAAAIDANSVAIGGTSVLSRSIHTGTQLASTISNFAATVAGLPAASAAIASAIADGAVSTAAKVASGILTDTHVNAANKDGVAGTASMRTLGTGAQQASAGNHTHSNPSGMSKIASGSYSGNGSYPRAFTGLGFVPKALLVQQTTTTTGRIMVYLGHDAVTLFHLSSPSFLATTSTFDADGFTLLTNSSMNASGQNYLYVAIG